MTIAFNGDCICRTNVVLVDVEEIKYEVEMNMHVAFNELTCKFTAKFCCTERTGRMKFTAASEDVEFHFVVALAVFTTVPGLDCRRLSYGWEIF